MTCSSARAWGKKVLLPSEWKRLAVERAVVILNRRLPRQLAGLGRDASRLRGGVRGPSRAQGWRDRFGKESRSQGPLSFQTTEKVVPGAGAGGMPRAGHGWPAAGSGSRTAQIPAGHPTCVRAGPPQLPEVPPASEPGRRGPNNTNANIPRLGKEPKKTPHQRGFFMSCPALPQANGSCSTIVCSRSGPVLTMLSGQPASSSSARR